MSFEKTDVIESTSVVKDQSISSNSIPEPTISTNIDKLGYYLDGWADLIEGMGDKRDEVRSRILNSLQRKQLPDTQVSAAKGYVSVGYAINREYFLAITDPGATTAIYVENYGGDLYTSWRTFINPVLNTSVIVLVLIIAAVLGLFTGGIHQSGGAFGMPAETSFSFLGWIAATMVLIILAAAGMAFAGRILKGNFLAYFFIEPTIFDADDITVMSLAVHQTVSRALDVAGIDISKLRLKRDFKGGRRDENV